MKKETIDKFKAEPADRYADIDLDRLVAYAMYRLDQEQVPCYFENIVVASFKLFPNKFALQTYPEYPDSNRVGKSTRRLVDSKRKGWARGTVEHGYNLTELGRDVAVQTAGMLAGGKKASKPASRSRGRTLLDEFEEIRKSDLFNAWSSGQGIDQIGLYDIASMLGALPHTPRPDIKRRLIGLKEGAKEYGDSEMGKFLIQMGELISD